MRIRFCLSIVAVLLVVQSTEAAITGNPLSDGWASQGNSLSNGTYVRGTANYAFDTYSAALVVDSALRTASGNVWNIGDTVIGVGGVFNSITAVDAGWDSFTGTAVNSLLANSTGPKIQAKFGTGVAVTTPWSVSTIAPGAGNGVGSLGNGGTGSIQVRSSGYLTQADWTNNAGQLMNLASSSHISSYLTATPSTSVARLIWNVSGGELSSWQILLNVTQAGIIPDGNAIMTVQDGDNAYTDALVEVAPANAAVPEPASLAVWSLLALAVGGASWWRRRILAT